ncbi:unnamed protein product [Clonostachys rosea]|uniref:Secreted protein n=1 Tax=Bionectria ochroleuca TaxID=29856 RepID=A0ABY6V274_BIOOC|nr:unnamed protein product [Clonostachys rosea]
MRQQLSAAITTSALFIGCRVVSLGVGSEGQRTSAGSRRAPAGARKTHVASTEIGILAQKDRMLDIAVICVSLLWKEEEQERGQSSFENGAFWRRKLAVRMYEPLLVSKRKWRDSHTALSTTN